MNEHIATRTISGRQNEPDFRIKVIGVGGAGSNALDRLVIKATHFYCILSRLLSSFLL